MAKGDIIFSDIKEYKDEYTGRKVMKLTPDGSLFHSPYFQSKMVSDDNRYVVIAGGTEDERNIYRLDMRNGEILQLTEGPGILDYTPRLMADDKHVIFSRENDIVRVNIDTLKEELVYQTPSDWGVGLFSLSPDDRYIVNTELFKADEVPRTKNWDYFRPQCEKRPRCRLIMHDVKKGETRVVYEVDRWLNHAQMRPYDSSTIMFCQEGPGDLIIARLWLINSDGSDLRNARPKEKYAGSVTHEYWLDDGSKLAYVCSFKDDREKSTVRFMDPVTLEEEIVMEITRSSHLMSNHDNSLIVGDSTKDIGFIVLMDVNNKTEARICYHGSTWKSYGNTQDAHPHPAFSPDSSMVIFTSDRDGMPGVYRVDL